ncbi:MAG: poly-gamma-glutamate synthase PgsB [Clostridia bacterium]|nr:poly-gamma-glutamate synthase PgsB [Clostridia bacterium]
MQFLICLLFILFLFLLCFEQVRAKKDRSVLQHIVYVNGIRGKSTVTRLIDAGLRAGGYQVFCKTTGTEPMTIDIADTEQRIRRIGPSNIREQLRTLHKAARQGAQVLVIECMAVQPELQAVSQDKMLKADISVITNVRRDHTDVMGTTPEEICDSLCSTAAQNGVLFTAEHALLPRIEQNAKSKNCRVIPAFPDGSEPDFDFPDNVALALAVCKHLGVARDTALSGMLHFHPDPYALACYRVGGGIFVNAFSANDAESTRHIYRKVISERKANAKKVILLRNHRADRGTRTRDMAALAAELPCDEIWLMGAGKSYFERTLRKKQFSGSVHHIRNADDPRLSDIPDGTLIFAAGNIAGNGKKLVDRIRKEGINLV